MTEKELKKAVEEIAKRYSELNIKYIRQIAEQIKAIGELNPKSLNQIAEMVRMNANISEIVMELNRLTELTKKDVKAIMERLTEDEIMNTRYLPYYAEKSGLPEEDITPEIAKQYVGADAEERLRRSVLAMAAQTDDRLENLSNTAAISEPYRAAIDKAVLAVHENVTSYTEAMRDTVREIGSAGMQVRYESGYHRRLDTAARQNILDATGQLAQTAAIMVGEALEYNAFEISAHAMSAPDHEPVQGHVFLVDEFYKLQQDQPSQDVDGHQYESIRRPIKEWNCGHFAYPFDTRYSKRKYTDEQLQKFKDDNEKGCVIGDRKYTLYEASQIMRRIECEIRREKDTAIAAQASGDEQLRVDCQLRINHLSDVYKKVTDASGLKPRRERMTVEGFRKAKTPKTDDKNALTSEEKSGNIKSEEKFTPAKTIEEANEYAKKSLGIPNASYAGADLRVANEWNRGLAEAFQRFPELKKNFGFTGTLSERHNLTWDLSREFYGEWYRKKHPEWSESQVRRYAQNSATDEYNRYASKDYSATYAVSNSTENPALAGIRGIAVNSDLVKDTEAFRDSLIANVEGKHSPEGCYTLRSILDHEIGHRLDELVGASKDHVITGLIDSMTNDELTEKLSSYSWNNDNNNKYEEAIAEAWSEYCNNPNCRPVAMAIGKRIEELYDDKYGR